MKKKLVIALATGFSILGTAFIAQAALMEITPVSYSFDRATDVGSYDYVDSGGIQLTDGQYGVAPWWADLGNGPAYEWVGWVWDSPVNIDFNLGSLVEINQINIGTVQDVPDDVVLPSVNLYSSNNGSTWNLFHNYFVPESDLNNEKYYTYNFTDLSITGQYFRVSLYNSYDGPWTFTDEIDFYHDSTASVPEPATMLLFGSGIVSLIGFRIKRKKRVATEQS